MRTVLKPFNKSLAVLGLTSCLTTLQFMTPAYAQDPGSVRLTTEERQLLNETIYATPTILLAPQSGFQLETGYTRTEEEVQIKNLDGNSKISSDSGKVSLAYGLNSHLFFGVGMGYGAGKKRSDFAIAGNGSIQTSNKEGVTDPNIFVGGRMNMRSISIVGGLDYLVSTGKAEVQMKPNQVTDGTAKTGGSEITPSIAVFSNSRQNLILGSAIAYKFRTDRKTEIKDNSGFASEAKTKGGNEAELNLFLESPQNTHSFGSVLTYKNVQATEEQTLDTKTVKGTEKVLLTAFANIQATKNLSIIPAASYQYFMNDKVNDTDLKSQSVYSGQLNVRLSF